MAMAWLRAGIFVFLCTLTNYAAGAELIDHARALLKAAITSGPGKMKFSGPSQSGYPHLPASVWRASYERSGDFKWNLYYQLLEDGKRGGVIEKEIKYYQGGDVYYVFWLNGNNELVRLQKKVPNTSLLKLPQQGVELRLNAFIDFDPKGQITSISENLVLINDNRKEAHFSSLRLDDEGELKELRSGDFDYYQLVR